MKNTNYELIIVVANHGHSEEVMDAARAEGAGGGTVIHAKGTGLERAEKFLGVSIADEKELILIVTKTESKKAIMKSIMDHAGLESKARSVVFSLPVTDTAGLRLQEATDALAGFGSLYMAQSMASGVIPQICGIFGSCGGGMAVSAALADFTLMEEKSGKLFVNSPNTLDGNYKEKCDTSSAKFQSEETGMVDFCGTEEEVLDQIRSLISILPASNEDDLSYDECEDDLNRVCEGLEGWAGDTREALRAISDGHFFLETKKAYGPAMVTGFIRLNGVTVGCVANRTEIYGENGEKEKELDGGLTSRGCEKAAEMVNFCDAFGIPVMTLVNVKGYQAVKCTEKKIAKAAAKLTYAYANATVPKVTVITGKAYGTPYLTMGSKAVGADIVYAWPGAEIGMMDAQSAARIMYADEIAKAEDGAALLNEKADQYRALQSSPEAAARRGYVDDIIEAKDTRKRVIAAFEMLFTKREDRPAKKHGTV